VVRAVVTMVCDRVVWSAFVDRPGFVVRMRAVAEVRGRLCVSLTWASRVRRAGFTRFAPGGRMSLLCRERGDAVRTALNSIWISAEAPITLTEEEVMVT